MMNTNKRGCPICNAQTLPVGEKHGIRIKKVFRLMRCESCGFAFVDNPSTDFATIYDQAYYEGKGSDPLVDYSFEYENPAATIRRYEWEGIASIVSTLAPSAHRWLDYGCGNGGLVRYLQSTGKYELAGYDTGAWAEKARADGLPILRDADLPAYAGSFDVITAIEVIEHIIDPIGFLRTLRKLARPGALLFLTTQNASNAPTDFVRWSYVVPEIHVSFFTPTALSFALKQAGFEPLHARMVGGWEQILRFKVLKNLHVRRMALWERLLPWSAIGRLINHRYRFTALPMGIAR